MISRATKKAGVLIATVAVLGACAAFFTVLREPQSPETMQPSSDSPQLFPSMQPPHVAVADLEPDVLEAIQSAEQAVRDNPESGIAWGWLGMVSHIHGFFRVACECYSQAALLNPESFRWPYLRGLALAKTNHEQAVAEFRLAVRLAPDETPIHVHIGELLIASGRPDEATEHFVRATELSPTCSHAWLGRARVRMAYDDYEQALHFLDRSAEFAENHGAVYSTLARVRYRLGDVEGAERAARRAEGMKPNGNLRDGTYAALIGAGVSVRWYKHRGNRLFELGRYAEACSEFARAVNARPDIAEFRFSLALAQTRASLFEDAAETYQKGLAIRSDDSRQLNAYGVVLCRLRRTADGIVALRKAIRLQPNYEEAHFNLWLAMLELDRLEEAVAALQKGVERTPDSALLPTTLAWVLATHPDADFRRPEDALELATRACELTEMRDPAALISQAAAQAGLGHWGEAEETARTALQLAEAGGRADLADQCRKLASSYAAGRPVFVLP